MGENVNYSNHVNLTGIYVSGRNGVLNEKVQIQVYSNNELIETEIGLADSEGNLYCESSLIYFK